MFRDLKNARAFKKASETAAEDEIVCGTYTDDGEPLYFTAPREATEDEIRDRAFAARNGRPLSTVERHLLELAESQRPNAGS
tara:strand:- start:3506 stop:3751 length:246 start_codon:yes stop_codon:yes gene_type:complete